MSLYGIYGSHTIEACPVNNRENAAKWVSLVETNPTSLLEEYRIKEIVGQFHSAFEHTFLWVLDSEDPHRIERFALETGLSSFNTLKIVPLSTLTDDIVPQIKKMHHL
jgi:hypothetical protein